MKYFLVLVVVAVCVWRWRNGRVALHQQHAHKTAAPAPTVVMVACAQCGVHLPAHDALPGKHGHYCSQAHRQAREV